MQDFITVPGIFGILWGQYQAHPERVVIGVEGTKLSYRSLVAQGNRVAAGLYGLGVRAGDRVGMLTPNSCNWYIWLYAILRLGAIPVPFDPQMGEYEIRALFDRIGIRVVLVPPEFRGLNHADILHRLQPHLPDLRAVVIDGTYAGPANHLSFASLLAADPTTIEGLTLTLECEDSNIFFCTTGSTGTPKIVDEPCRLINNNMARNAARWSFHEGDRFFLTMPLFHCAGFGWGVSCLSAGGSIFYDSRFSPTTLLETIEKERITKVLITPTIAKLILTHPKFHEADLSSLEAIIFTGEYLSPELADRFTGEMGLQVINALGMTEAFVFLDWDSRRDTDTRPDCLSEITGIDIRVLDEQGMQVGPGGTGVVYIRNSTMKSYFRAEDITRSTLSADGWLDTGDIAERQQDGRIRFIGRKKRVIKRGGNLVSPEEIEQFLRTHPACAGVIVAGEEDSLIGERLIAYFQSAGDKVLKAQDLLRFCKGKISAYKIPDEFVFVKEIPKTVGKANPKLIKQAEIVQE